MEPSGQIQIQCEKVSSRLDYVARYLEEQLGAGFKLITGEKSHDESAIHYGRFPIPGRLNIYDSGLLTESSIRSFEPEVNKVNGTTLLFPAPPGFQLPFDIFSAVFYMLSRYEEYLPFKPDHHGRFEAQESIAFRKFFLDEPVVDQWVLAFSKLLKREFPHIRFYEPVYLLQSTIDVDNPWAFRNKGMLRNAGGLLRDMIFLDGNMLKRIGSVTRIVRDPYDVYSWIRKNEDRNGISSVYFFLSGDYGCFDVNYALKTSSFRRLIREISNDRMIGIHPSFRSNENFSLLKTEFDLFSEILGKKPEISRQHFLMLKFPETYTHLIELGIRHDYSMGYASMPGFRAGTSRPFKFYNLETEAETPLTVHPFTVMDITLQQYLRLDPHVAAEKITDLAGKTRSVKGVFTMLWHNESLSNSREWKGWHRVFEEALQKCGIQ